METDSRTLQEFVIKTSRRNLLTGLAGMATATSLSMGRPRCVSGEDGALQLWHSWSGIEVEVLEEQVLPAWSVARPDVAIESIRVAADEIENRFRTEAPGGRGPDLLIGDLALTRKLALEQLVLPFDDLVEPETLGSFIQTTVDALTFQGEVYGLPESFETVALYVNRSVIESPPETTSDLIAMAAGMDFTMPAHYGFALLSNFYHPAGYLFGFGGSIFDATGEVAIDSPETTAFLTWLHDLSEKQGIYQQNDRAALNALFKEGRAAMLIDGPWAIREFLPSLGPEKLSIIPLPRISEHGGAFPMPFLNVRTIMINANVSPTTQAAAVEFATWFTGPDAAKMLAADANHLPANRIIDLSQNAFGAAFMAQAEHTTPLPTGRTGDAIWEPAGRMITDTIETRSTPAEAAAAAQRSIEKAIEATNSMWTDSDA